MAIYARENGQGMAFPVSDEKTVAANLSAADKLQVQAEGDEPTPPPSSGRPALTRVK
jgi:stringent starvation protein B